MQVATGTVKDGKIVVEGVPLAEGALVTLVARGADEGFSLSEEQELELIEALVQIDQGEFLTLDALLETLPGRRSA